MQRLGVEVWPVHTVQFSNHTGYGAWRGEVFAAETIRDVVRGVGERWGARPLRRDVLSATWARPPSGGRSWGGGRRARREPAPPPCIAAIPCSATRRRASYVRPGITEFMARARRAPRRHPHPEPVRAEPPHRPAERHPGRGARRHRPLQARGPRVVVVTSAATGRDPRDRIDLLAGRVRAGGCSGCAPHASTSRSTARAIASPPCSSSTTPGSAPPPGAGEGGGLGLRLLRATAEAGSREILTVAAAGRVRRPLRRVSAEAV